MNTSLWLRGCISVYSEKKLLVFFLFHFSEVIQDVLLLEKTFKFFSQGPRGVPKPNLLKEVWGPGFRRHLWTPLPVSKLRQPLEEVDVTCFHPRPHSPGYYQWHQTSVVANAAPTCRSTSRCVSRSSSLLTPSESADLSFKWRPFICSHLF